MCVTLTEMYVSLVWQGQWCADGKEVVKLSKWDVSFAAAVLANFNNHSQNAIKDHYELTMEKIYKTKQ